MRRYAQLVRLGMVGVLAAGLTGCGGSEDLAKMDAATTADAADDHKPAADGAGGAGATTDARDARDAAPESPADAPRETVPDAAPMDLAAADATGDAPASADAGGDSAADAAGPMLVTVQFSGQVLTVAGTPLGLGGSPDASVLSAPVSGSFAYDLRLADQSPTDPQRGRYLHSAAVPSQFTFNTSGHVVTGSGLAIVETENLNPDTFRFLDGQQNDGVTRTMKLDGTDDPALVVRIAITDASGAALTSDAEPDPFPFTDGAGSLAITSKANVTHTFSIQDGVGNTLLMQLDSMTQQ